MTNGQPTTIDSRSDARRDRPDDSRPDGQEPGDGRTARRTRNRGAVLDAVVELFAEGDLAPAAQEVADRSGVSLRSVYRYFEDVDDLIATAIDHHITAVAPRLAAGVAGSGPLDRRIRTLCEHRMALYAELRAVYQASIVRSAAQPDAARRVREIREQLTAQVEDAFRRELDQLPSRHASTVTEMIDALTQFDTIHRLVEDRGQDLDTVTGFLVDAVSTSLDRTRDAAAIGA